MDVADMQLRTDAPLADGLPIVGSVMEMAKDPARFFVKMYRKYGPVFRVNMMGTTYKVIAGVEAANFLNSREGKEALRSKEFWQGLVEEYGAKHTMTGTDGTVHNEMRAIMRRGFSRDTLAGRYDELITISDRSIDRIWKPGTSVPVVTAMQYMVVEQLGEILTGTAPLEYVTDIRTTIMYILNVLVTRQRPRFFMMDPRYKRARARVDELGEKMIRDLRAKEAAGTLPDNLLGDIMRANRTRPDLFPDSDLPLVLTGPYVAGLDTVANTVAAFVYRVLKHQDQTDDQGRKLLPRLLAEADELYAKPSVDEMDLVKLPGINGAIQESMRLHPIAVAQMRTATRDFGFQGHLIREGEMLFIGTSVPHFMDEYFPNAEKFDIDRYERPRAEHVRPGVYSPYGRGPHTCLGKPLAEVLMALSMSRLLYKRELELDPPDYELVTKTAPTPGPSMKFKVKVKSIRH